MDLASFSKSTGDLYTSERERIIMSIYKNRVVFRSVFSIRKMKNEPANTSRALKGID